MNKAILKSVFLFWCLALWAEGTAQTRIGHNWYFGNSNQAIRFNRIDNTPTLVTTKATPFGTGGSAVATDRVSADLLFYTDGNNIYDRTNAVMPNGTGLGANTSANQPVVVARVPGQQNQYYVFVNNANFTTAGTISYRIVDMSQFGNSIFPGPPLGSGLTAGNTVLLSNRSEGMIVIPHANGEDFWIVSHEAGTNNYSAFQFTAAGPGTNTILLGAGLIGSAANFAYHPGTGRIAVSPQESNHDVEIFSFNNTTGTLFFSSRVLNSGNVSTINQSVYDVEFSSNGQFLYISRHGQAGVQADVLQYDLNNPTVTLTSVLPQPNTISRSFGLQMAPDSAIYHLYQATAGGPFLLGRITNTDTVAAAVNYTRPAFPGAANFNATQFPAFATNDSVSLSVNFTTQGLCANSATSFFPTVTPGADSLIWDFGDGNSATAWSPVHTYQNGGAFNVSVTAFLGNSTATFSAPVNITDFQIQITLPTDTVACACELPVNQGVSGCPGTIAPFQINAQVSGGTPAFQWYGPGGLLPGQTTSTLRADSAGYYYLIATQGACSTYAGVNLREYDSLDRRANIWHFGQNAGIDFNQIPAVGINGPIDSPEGVSVISDRNGQVIFSTDGNSIFDRTGADITPSGGLGGDPEASQSALIIPVAGDETLFYIFTTQEVFGDGSYELRYSLFDLKLNNGQGAIAEHNVLLMSGCTERITGNQNWLIAHEYGNNSFRAFRITQNGIANPVISAIGSDHGPTSAESGQGYMKLGPQNRLAVALARPGVSNVLEIFDFIDSTGVVTNFRTANLNTTAGQVYGVEFSPSGNKVFASVLNTNSQLVEFAFDSLGNPYFKQRVAQPGRAGALQIGPDGRIYLAIEGASSLGAFQANEDTTALTPLPPAGSIALAPGTTSTLGLPNFIQNLANPIGGPGITVAGVCIGSPTSLTALPKDASIDRYDWFFGDGQALIDADSTTVSHTYAAPGTYTVTLRIYNKCENPVGVFTRDVVISPLPADPSAAAVLCTGSVTLDANPSNAPALTYAWATGETTETIVVTRQTVYNVAITNAAGCVRDASFVVADNRPQVNLPPNTTICQGTSLPPLNAQNPGATYAWTINGVNSGNTQTQGVTNTIPGTFEYEVRVTDPVTTCFTRDSTIYTINPSPTFTAVSAGPIACGATTGQININITAPASNLFQYNVTAPAFTPRNEQDLTVGTYPESGLAQGTYNVVVIDQVSQCISSVAVPINNLAFTVSGVPSGTCDPIQLAVTTTLPGGAAATYRVIDSGSGTDAIPVTPVVIGPGGTFTTALAGGLPSNNRNYVVEVISSGCVAASTPINITQAARVPVTLSYNGCVNPVTVTATGGTTFSWTGPSITSATNIGTITVNPGQGSFVYNVRVGQAGFCDRDTTVTVLVDNNVVPDFTQTTPCSDQVTLTATPAGVYTYRWFRNAVLIPGGQTITAGLTDNGVNYQVQVYNTVSGCIFNSTTKPVTVTGPVEVTLASTLACEGLPFTLTATPTPSVPTFEWKRNGTMIAGQTGATLNETRDGSYQVKINIGVCADSAQFAIGLAPVTPGALPTVAYICPDPENSDPLTRTVTLDPGPDFSSYAWSTGETTQTIVAAAPGLYTVDLVNLFGCPSSDEIDIIEDCVPRVTGPNAFRPGGANKEFFLFTFFIDDSDFQVFIFNRWGEMVFSSNDKAFRWNGGYNNNASQLLPPGTYTYVVKYKSSYRPEDGIQEKRGGVVLLR